MTGTTARGARITGDARRQLAAEYATRYAAGESIRSMALSSGRSYGFVQTLLREEGVSTRTRGGVTRGAEAEAARLAAEKRIAEARARFAAGKTPASTVKPPTSTEDASPGKHRSTGDMSGKRGPTRGVSTEGGSRKLPGTGIDGAGSRASTDPGAPGRSDKLDKSGKKPKAGKKDGKHKSDRRGTSDKQGTSENEDKRDKQDKAGKKDGKHKSDKSEKKDKSKKKSKDKKKSKKGADRS